MKFQEHIGSFILFMVCLSCAEPSAPIGGPKDLTPPAISKTKYSTPNGMTNFTYDKVLVTFDEWIRLVNPTQQVIITPPLKGKPNIFVKNKSVVVQWEDTLRSNTTYSVQFGDAIVDITEGNAAKNIKRVFSTGPFIDSCTISGLAIDYFSGKALKDATILLYDTSATNWLKVFPYYFTKTASDGTFTINYIKDGMYNLCALLDENNNYFYDKIDEKIAFNLPPILINKNPSIDTLFLFKERQETRILSYDYTTSHLHITFNNQDLIGNFSCTIKDYDSTVIKQYQNGDSLEIWHTSIDTYPISLIISNPAESFFDTLVLKNKTIGAMSIDSSMLDEKSPKTFYSDESIELRTFYPIIDFNVNNWFIKTNEKTIPPVSLASSLTDPCRLQFSIDSSVEDSFQLIILPGSVKDIRGILNPDTLFISYVERDTSSYGLLTIKSIQLDSSEQYILLIYNNGQELERITINNRSDLIWSKRVDPGTYVLRLVSDENKNGRWDSGFLENKRNPEKLTVSKELTVKAGWENEFTITPD